MDFTAEPLIIGLAVVTILAVIVYAVFQWNRTRHEQRVRGERPAGGIDDLKP